MVTWGQHVVSWWDSVWAVCTVGGALCGQLGVCVDSVGVQLGGGSVWTFGAGGGGAVCGQLEVTLWSVGASVWSGDGAVWTVGGAFCGQLRVCFSWGVGWRRRVQCVFTWWRGQRVDS